MSQSLKELFQSPNSDLESFGYMEIDVVRKEIPGSHLIGLDWRPVPPRVPQVVRIAERSAQVDVPLKKAS